MYIPLLAWHGMAWHGCVCVCVSAHIWQHIWHEKEINVLVLLLYMHIGKHMRMCIILVSYISLQWKSIVTNLLVEYGLPIEMKMQQDIRVFNAIENVQVKLKLKFSHSFFGVRLCVCVSVRGLERG